MDSPVTREWVGALIQSELMRALQDQTMMPPRSVLPQKLRPVDLSGAEAGDGVPVSYDGTNELTTFNPVSNAGIAAGADIDLTKLNASYALVYNTSGQTLTTGSATDITFDSEVVDTDGYHSTSSNTDRFTAQFAGPHLLFAMVRFVANSTGIRRAFFYKNGTTSLWDGRLSNLGASQPAYVPVVGLVDLDVDDYVTLRGFQNSGGDLDVDNGSWLTVFGIVYLGAG